MSDLSLETAYRRFLLYVTVFVLVGTTLELAFTEHTEGFVQLIPFALIGAGLLATGAAIARESRRTIVTLRAVMAVMAAGALYGVYEHVRHNLAFELEIRPSATLGDVFWEALFGASPFLAPGVLGLAALLAAAATYRHPVLKRR